ncbi:MAG: glycoside hydrolase family 3 N-terminal domain-containing protein, partial [Thiolinea sp.]
GGTWPGNNKRATAADWVTTADSYWEALDEAYADRGFRIPFMWGTDAVHGHNNVFGATIFPHNIGLGAANDPDLIYRIGEATAKEVAATGLDWTFAPTLAVPRNDRWGRTYEGYSEDPAITYRYAGKIVQGLQEGSSGLHTDTQVLATLKHWIGDGGTLRGIDQGQNHYTEEQLINLHAPGYFSALKAGAQVVMTSFNSWHQDTNYGPPADDGSSYNKKLHGSYYLITEVLKGKLGFDGLVVTDWNGHGQINGCSNDNCPQAIQAGNDIFMIPERKHWQAFYHNTIAQVKDGTLAMSRIDDAVTRILRVKMRAGLWEKPKPSERSLAGNQSILGAEEHRTLAREAVRKSLVLLKNNADALPLNKQQTVYLAGSAADSLEKQHGGWSLSWQGKGHSKADFPQATTLKQAFTKQIGAENIVTDMSQADENTVAVIAIGEEAYAEGHGDIADNKTLGFTELKTAYAEDLALIKAAKAAGLKVITLFFSGRPLYVNDVINYSDAFVAVWLPGSETGGISDVLYRNQGADFSGRLSYSWPNTKCADAINTLPPHIPDFQQPETEQSLTGEHTPLFAYGYGLSYAQPGQNMPDLPLDTRDYDCFSTSSTQQAQSPLYVYGPEANNEFRLVAMGASNQWQPLPVSSTPVVQGQVTITPIDRDTQYDAANIRFTGNGSGDHATQVFLQYARPGLATDQSAHIKADSTLQFDIRVIQTPDNNLMLGQHTVFPKRAEFRFNDFLPAKSGEWSTVKIPLNCFQEHNVDPNHPYDIKTFNTPLLFFTIGKTEFDLSRVQLVPRSLDEAEDAITCADIR